MTDKDLKITVTFTFAPAEQRAIAKQQGEAAVTREMARSWTIDQIGEATGALLDAYLDAERLAAQPVPDPTLPLSVLTPEELDALRAGYSDDDWSRGASVEAHQLLDAPNSPLVYVVMGEDNVPETHWVEGVYLSEDAAEDARIEQQVEYVQEGYAVYGAWPVQELEDHRCQPEGATECATCRALRRWIAANVPTEEFIA